MSEHDDGNGAAGETHPREHGGAVAALVGTDCGWCDGAALQEAAYKGDRALVCPDCGTPALRLF